MKISRPFQDNAFFWLVVLCMIILVCAVFSTPPWVYAFFFNSDGLYLPTLYDGLFVDGYSIKSFALNPSMLLVPDIVVFFIIRAISGNAIFSLFTFGMAQHLLIFLGIALVYRQLYKQFSWFLSAMSALLMLLFFMGAILANDFTFAFFGLMSTIHTGAFVMALFSLGLTLLFLKEQKRSVLVLTIFVLIISLISDLLFILMYFVPVAITSGFMAIKFRKKKHITILITLGATLLFSLWLHGVLERSFFDLLKLPSVFQPDKILPSFMLFMKHMGDHLTRMNSHSLILLLAIFSFILHLIILYKQYRRNEMDSTISFYVACSVLFMAGIFWMPVITGNYTGIDIMRYNISSIYLAILNSGMLAAYFLFNKKTNFPYLQIFRGAFVVGLAVMFYIGVTHVSKRGLDQFFNYRPTFVQELDEIAKQEKLLCGAANFWYAKPITVLSHQGLKVYHTFDQIVPFIHATSSRYYFDDDQVFNFAVLSSFSDKSAYHEYIDKEGRIVKYGDTEVLILPPFKFDKVTGLPYFLDDELNHPTTKD